MDAAPLVHAPPATVGELAGALGLRVADLEPRGVAYAYAWAVHHELAPGSIEELARRALTAYRVPLGDAAACEAALRARHGEPVEVRGRHRCVRRAFGWRRGWRPWADPELRGACGAGVRRPGRRPRPR